MKNFQSTLENFNTRLWQFHVPVPDELAALFIEGDNKRVICKINNAAPYPAALIKNQDYWFILVNKQFRQRLNLSEGDKVNVTLEKDYSEYGHEMPEELQVLMDQDEEGNRFFQELTKGKQRALIFLVNKVKNPNSRLNKSLAIISHLKEVNGALDFKALNEKIKYYNNLDKNR
ncbi:YdeI/OmpD-associated family protein [Lunatibacter salilacus]|uniref:YdeI/OmpD-associated family protein n=1 Tax=Lunatibacter salilacus TaxID=2483804 RepID=UPI00131C310A|nr:YdeI/OmpD-associated family protein [Lunatibacter salilacus]